MNKAFIFDMDGVLVDSENAWEKYKGDFFEKLLGEDIYQKIGGWPIGLSVNAIFDKAKLFGFKMSRQEFQEINDKAAQDVYGRADLTLEVDRLIEFLIKNNFKLGLVSASAAKSVKTVLQRLSIENKFENIISLNERMDLRHKPHPDGYMKMMEILESEPNSTIILEDSNRGIESAMASGAFTIAFTKNLIKDYKQIAAHAKANSMEEVIEIVRNYSSKS